jgi:hypothetical protein
LKSGAAEAAVQDIHVVIVVHLQLAVQAEAMQFKQLILIQDANIVFVQAEVGHVVNHIHVHREWGVNPMLTVTI